MIERLEKIEKRYEEIKTELTKKETLNNIDLLTKLSKEQRKLEEVVNKYQRYKTVKKQIKDDKELLKDEELKDIAQEELKSLEQEQQKIEEELEILLLPKDENDDKNIIMEIRGAAGGDEANIFAGDLFRMYQRYAEKQNWKVEIINAEDSQSGGFSQIECLIKGEGVYSKLKYESGAHRVQRIPTTESGGRIHTSTATVIIMPEEENVSIEVKPEDIKTDVYRSGGAGGQSVNTTDSAVRMTHIPTGIVVTCQNERSQIRNKEKALEILKNKLYLLKEEEEASNLKKMTEDQKQISFGSGKRSYVMCPYTLVKDNDSGYETPDVTAILDGKLDDLILAGIRR